MMLCIIQATFVLSIGPLFAMSSKSGMLRGHSAASDSAPIALDAQNSCATLSNQGTYFSVSVTLGTPMPGTAPQKFDLVADTGSNAVVVTSCACVELGYCFPHDKCFRGTNRSSSFLLDEGTDAKGHTGPMGVSLSYGSGTVSTLVATEAVQVADRRAVMDEGVLLMVDRRELRVGEGFMGILGLGPNDTAPSAYLQAKASSGMHAQKRLLTGTGQVFAEKMFMTSAGINRYSLCFNDQGKPGAMRMDVPELEDALPAIGKFHWGTGIQGFSVGKADAPVVLCDPKGMKPGQVTPCGAIPDSGTTLIMGPEDGINKLFASLCDEWSRCREAHNSQKAHNSTALIQVKNLSKSELFTHLLFHCESWMSDDDGINEVPSIFLTLGQANKTKVLELSAWSFITQSLEEEYVNVTRYLYGILPLSLSIPTGKTKKVCVPSFGSQQYDTNKNGPVWILGTPLFYEFVVGFDLAGPSVSFADTACTTCDETSASFLSSRNEVRTSKLRRGRRLRRTSGVPRVPSMDTTLPL